jgi:hypothetical protein
VGCKVEQTSSPVLHGCCPVRQTIRSAVSPVRFNEEKRVLGSERTERLCFQDPMGVTIATQLTIDRLPALRMMAQNWDGTGPPCSASGQCRADMSGCDGFRSYLGCYLRDERGRSGRSPLLQVDLAQAQRQRRLPSGQKRGSSRTLLCSFAECFLVAHAHGHVHVLWRNRGTMPTRRLASIR